MESALRKLAPVGFRLIETLRWEPVSGFARLPAHLARLAGSAHALGVQFDVNSIERALVAVSAEGPLRVRLTVALDGTIEVETAPLPAAKAEWALAIASERLDSGDRWLRVKSTERRRYDVARAALPPGVDEIVFLNERDEVCEGTICNVFLALADHLVTPPLACGLLPGVLRAELLASGRCAEAVLRQPDLRHGRIFVGNSLRGLIPARLAET